GSDGARAAGDVAFRRQAAVLGVLEERAVIGEWVSDDVAIGYFERDASQRLFPMLQSCVSLFRVGRGGAGQRQGISWPQVVLGLDEIDRLLDSQIGGGGDEVGQRRGGLAVLPLQGDPGDDGKTDPVVRQRNRHVV